MSAGRGRPDQGIDAEAASVLRTAIMDHEQGRLTEAAAGYQAFLSRHPDHPDALNLFGYLAHQTGDHQTALDRIQRSIARGGDRPPFVFNLAKVFHALGRLDEAADAYERVLAIDPKALPVHFNLAVLLETKDEPERAAQHYRTIIDADPRNVQALTNLGNLEWKRGDAETAEGLYRRTLAVDPNVAQAASNLAAILWQNGNHDDALAYFKESLRVDATNPATWQKLGTLLGERGKLDAAVQALKRALDLDPDNAVLLSDLGYIYVRLGDVDSALEHLHRSLALRPGHAGTLNTLAIVCLFRGQIEDAIGACKEAIAREPEFATVHSTLATVYKDSGDPDRALACFDRAIALAPDDPMFLSNKILAMHYSADIGTDAIWEESRNWGGRFGGKATSPSRTGHPNAPDPTRRLRIGYLSPDFRRHSVAYLMEPVLAAHDRSRMEVFCYAELANPDETSARIKALSDHWRVTFGQYDDQVAQRIRDDEIDILVDLAGHTASNRLTVFARKPAPVQVTWLGYPNTTGLDEIDYRLSDAISDPPGMSDRLHSETIVRLPNGFHCYGPPPEAPAVSPLPAITTGHLTFGAFNNLAKVTQDCIETWAAVLAAIPDSHLMIKSIAFRDEGTRERFAQGFAACGIARERLALVDFIPSTAGHLGVYGQIDIALDTVPYNGTVTTCEALWMGVPVVTRTADRHAGRVGASLLKRVGLEDLVADTPDQFIAVATALARDLDGLERLRAGLRNRVAGSPLCDAAGFTEDLETAYRDMWQSWCQSRSEKH